MPQSRIHASAAERQAAFRARREQARQVEIAAKGLPPLPAIPGYPLGDSWMAALERYL